MIHQNSGIFKDKKQVLQPPLDNAMNNHSKPLHLLFKKENYVSIITIFIDARLMNNHPISEMLITLSHIRGEVALEPGRLESMEELEDLAS